MSNLVALLDRWEQALMAQPAPDVEIHWIGPFLARISRTSNAPWASGAIPTGGAGDPVASLRYLRSLFAERGRTLRIEVNVPSYPALPRLLLDAGMTLENRTALMACSPDFTPHPVPPDVSVRLLRADSPDAWLQAFQTIRWSTLDIPAEIRAEQTVDRLRESLETGGSWFALGFWQGAPAGTAVLSPVDDVAEIVGVAADPRFRRRGIARSVTQFVLQQFFADGGRLVFLDAENEEAQALYHALDFALLGDRLACADSNAASPIR